jgi:UDP-glucuronate 4-epimerase
MALFLFTRNILAGKPIDVFNHGHHRRDFTYIDDIVEGIIRVSYKPAEADTSYDATQPDPSVSNAPYRVFNIGNNSPVQLLDFIHALEEALGVKSIQRMLPLQDGDVPETYADTEALRRWVGFVPSTDVRTGIARFVAWYRAHYQV